MYRKIIQTAIHRIYPIPADSGHQFSIRETDLDAKNPIFKKARELLGLGAIDYSSPVFWSCSICQIGKNLTEKFRNSSNLAKFLHFFIDLGVDNGLVFDNNKG